LQLLTNYNTKAANVCHTSKLSAAIQEHVIAELLDHKEHKKTKKKEKLMLSILRNYLATFHNGDGLDFPSWSCDLSTHLYIFVSKM
jgi:hypothetical protein